MFSILPQHASCKGRVQVIKSNEDEFCFLESIYTGQIVPFKSCWKIIGAGMSVFKETKNLSLMKYDFAVVFSQQL